MGGKYFYRFMFEEFLINIKIFKMIFCIFRFIEDRNEVDVILMCLIILVF